MSEKEILAAFASHDQVGAVRSILLRHVPDGFVGTFARYDDQPVGTFVAKDFEQGLRFLRVFVGAAEQYGILNCL